MTEAIAVQPGKTYYHGSVERRTSAPPCSFFTPRKGLASRYVYEPGSSTSYEIAKWILPARLRRPSLFIDIGDRRTYDEVQAAIAHFLPSKMSVINIDIEVVVETPVVMSSKRTCDCKEGTK